MRSRLAPATPCWPCGRWAPDPMWRDAYLSLARAEPGVQVGVLFVTLFGLLAVAGVATLRVGLRDDLSPLGRAHARSTPGTLETT